MAVYGAGGMKHIIYPLVGLVPVGIFAFLMVEYPYVLATIIIAGISYVIGKVIVDE